MKQQLKKIGLSFSLVTLLCASLLQVTGQTAMQLTKIYLEGGIGPGTFKGFNSEVGLKAIFKNKWSMTLSLNGIQEMTPKNEPSDYKPETGYVLFIPYTGEETVDMSIVSLTAGRYFSVGKNIWATAEGGLSYVKGEKVNYERTQQVSSNIIIAASTSSNYTTTKENKSTVGAMMQADIDWAFASFMGIGAGVYANINSIQSPIGLQVKLIIGKMGRIKKSKS
ncbi:MAG: hypothetical protein E6H10_06195 [Bacteroidetes bacterium]|nr:MAG: hypothetical protein E6H10_06195 [Bacteroidota bacterium]